MSRNTINQTLQIISIQHELSMSIGLDIHLEPMLYTFMERIKQRLSLLSVAVVFEPYSSSISLNPQPFLYLSFPRKRYELEKTKIVETAYELRNDNKLQFKSVEINNHDYYLFVIPEFGTLILERKHRSIETKVVEAIKPLMKKLSTSCLACVEHESLLKEIEYRNKAEHLLSYQSLHDPLTGLANRKQFNAVLDKHLINAIESNSVGALFIIDIDRFKVVNDNAGHALGDLLLKAISQRLSERLSENEILARVGGDEFALLLKPYQTDFNIAKQHVELIAKTITNTFSTPFHLNQQSIKITASVGIQLYPINEILKSDINVHKNALLHNADLAMYAVKRQSRDGFQFYNKDIHAITEQRTKIENALRHAIQDNEFLMNYQPIVNQHGQIVGAEALIRWKSKSLGWVSPADFIPIAEESGCIIEIGNWVLQQVCALLSKINENPAVTSLNYISINISPRQFSSIYFEEQLLATLSHYNLSHDKIRIEITEGIALENMDIALSKMGHLKQQGFAFMLDDFGSGYSSLSYINQLPLHTVKIDRAFITDIHNNVNNQVIVSAIIDICRHFKLECVVEGVEYEEEVRYLRNKGVTRFQGYHFFRPLPDVELLRTIQ